MYTYNQLYFQYKKLYSSYLKKIIPILNDFHEKQYDKNYWEPIIGLYLRRFLSNFIFLKKKIKKKKLYKNVKFKDIQFYKNYREFASSYDFENIDKKYFYKFNTNQTFKKYRINEINFFQSISNSIKIFFINFFIKLKITKVLFYESYFKKNLKRVFYLKTFFYLNSLPSLKFENYKIDKLKIFKNRLSIINREEFNKDLILKNILFFMPINYLENYEPIHRGVKKINLTNAIYIDGNEVSFDFIKFYMALIKLNKKKILTGQHSLRSGLEDYDIYFDYTKSISNYFLTWGWSNKYENTYKFSSLRIFSSFNKYKKLKKIETKNFNTCFILCSFSIIGECLNDNINENKKAEKSRIDLLKKLKKVDENKIVLKPRTGSFILQSQKSQYKKFEILKEKTRMYEILRKYDIIIFERVSLGIVECIYLDQPTIIYYPKSLYQETNNNYKELIFQLKKANIYFDDPKKVLKIVNSKQSVYEWWYKEKNILNRKKVLKNFASKFEYSDLKRIKKLTEF